VEISKILATKKRVPFRGSCDACAKGSCGGNVTANGSSWKLCAAIFIASLFFAACFLLTFCCFAWLLTGVWVNWRGGEGLGCLGSLHCLDVFRVNVNYQNCFGTWLTDKNPKQLKFLWRTELLLQIHKLE